MPLFTRYLMLGRLGCVPIKLTSLIESRSLTDFKVSFVEVAVSAITLTFFGITLLSVPNLEKAGRKSSPLKKNKIMLASHLH